MAYAVKAERPSVRGLEVRRFNDRILMNAAERGVGDELPMTAPVPLRVPLASAPGASCTAVIKCRSAGFVPCSSSPRMLAGLMSSLHVAPNMQPTSVNETARQVIGENIFTSCSASRIQALKADSKTSVSSAQ
jgi:hypothetical protein